MLEEIRQNGKTIVYSHDGISIGMLFNNIVDNNFSGEKYRTYLKVIVFNELKFVAGTVLHYRDGQPFKKGDIPDL